MSILSVKNFYVSIFWGCLRAGFGCGVDGVAAAVYGAGNAHGVGLAFGYAVGLRKAQRRCAGAAPGIHQGIPLPKLHGGLDGLSRRRNPHAAYRRGSTKVQTGIGGRVRSNRSMNHSQAEQDGAEHSRAGKQFFPHENHLLSFPSIYITEKEVDFGH